MFAKLSWLLLGGAGVAGIWVFYFSARKHSQPDGLEEVFLVLIFSSIAAVLWSLSALMGLIGLIRKEKSAGWPIVACLVAFGLTVAIVVGVV